MDGHDQRTCAQRTSRIAELNDRLRVTGEGGKIVLTRTVAAMGPQFVAALISAIQQFNDFDASSDPWGEHDFGSASVDDMKCFWKVDYYGLDSQYASLDPADETVTRRIMTIMTAGDL